jgi:hypothetical protein
MVLSIRNGSNPIAIGIQATFLTTFGAELGTGFPIWYKKF